MIQKSLHLTSWTSIVQCFCIMKPLMQGYQNQGQVKVNLRGTSLYFYKATPTFLSTTILLNLLLFLMFPVTKSLRLSWINFINSCQLISHSLLFVVLCLLLPEYCVALYFKILPVLYSGCYLLTWSHFLCKYYLLDRLWALASPIIPPHDL